MYIYYYSVSYVPYLNNVACHCWADDKCEGVGSSEEDQDNSGGETELPEIDPRAEDRELKTHLLKKYSGYLSSLKQELSKKKKKGKLPKDARQKLLNWWELHYKWPYPSVCKFTIFIFEHSNSNKFTIFPIWICCGRIFQNSP